MAITKRQIKNINDYGKFKNAIESKYGQKVNNAYTNKQGYTVLELENGDEIRVDESTKLIGNPFGRRGAVGSHFTKTKYSEFGIKEKGNDKFDFNYE